MSNQTTKAVADATALLAQKQAELNAIQAALAKASATKNSSNPLAAAMEMAQRQMQLAQLQAQLITAQNAVNMAAAALAAANAAAKAEADAAAVAARGAVSSPNVLRFDGVSCYGAAQVNVSESAHTLSIWFKTTNKNCGLFSVDSGENGANGHDRHVWLSDGAIKTRVWSNEVITSAGKSFADGNWHKVTHVFGGSIGGQRIYVDGKLEAKGTKAVSDFNWQDGINVGFSNDATHPYFTGEISEVAIWTIARTEADIMSNSETLTGNETGLLAYWNFMDGKNNQIIDRAKNKLVMTIKGKADWQRATDFSGVFMKIVSAKEISSIRSQGQALAEAVKPLSQGYKINPPAPLTPEPLSQLITKGLLPQYEAGKRLHAAIQGNSLTLSKELLGDFAEAGQIVSTIMNAFITISNPSIQFVNIEPGTSGEDGEPFSNDPASDMKLSTIQTAALHISGEATIFSGINVTLKYAEFAQLKGKPYGVLKFTSNHPIGIGAFLPSVPLLDAMVISSPVIVISSSGDIEDKVLDSGLSKGFNFFGTFQLGNSSDKAFKLIGGLIGIPEIALHGVVDLGESTPSYLMEASLPGEHTIINGSNFKVKFANTTLGVTIKGKPLEPAINLSNELIVTLKKGSDITNLVFTGGLKLEAESITGAFTMQAKSDQPYASLSGNVVSSGEWKEPFGIPGITIREMALQVGLTYVAPWIDNIGIHGNLKIGDIDGSISVLVDTNDPDQFVLAGATDKLTIFQVMSCMCVPTFVAYQAIPANIKSVMDKFVNLSLNNVKINIVPSGTSIGAIDFEEGITVMGKLNAWGWNASAYLNVDYLDGIEVRADMDQVNLLNVLIISGAQSDPNPKLSLTLSPKSIPELVVTGKINFLGLIQELLIKAGADGFTFYFDRSIANILDTGLACTFGDGGNLVAAGSIVFKLNVTIPSVFGDIKLVDISMNAASGIKVGPKYGFDATISGGFSFYGKTVTMPTLNLKIAPNDFQSVFNAVVKQITDNADAIFKAVFGTLAEWADAVKNGVLKYSGEIASVAKNVYKAAEKDVIQAYKTLGKGANDVARGLKEVYGYTGDGVAKALKGAGYAANEVGAAVKTAYGFTADATAIALKGAGYAVNEVGGALKSAYNASSDAAAKALKGAGYAVNEVGGFVKSSYSLTAQATATALKGAGYAVSETGGYVKTAYNLGADGLNTALSGAGYAADQVNGFFKDLGGEFASFGSKVGNAIVDTGKKLDPTKW